MTTLLPFCLPLFLCGCLAALSPFGEKTDYVITGAGKNEELGRYLQGVLEDRLAEKLEETGDPQADAHLESYREEMIRADLLKALRAKGYYSGQVNYDDDQERERTGRYAVTPGPRYGIASVAVEPASFSVFLDEDLARKGAPLDAEAVLAAQQALYGAIGKGRCYFHLDVRNAVVLDRRAHTGRVTFHVDAGPEGHFSSAVFTGQDDVAASYLDKLVPWKAGDCYHAGKVEELRAALLESGLFSRAEAVLPDKPLPDGGVPVEIRLTERARRTVRAGGSYYSDEGAGITLGWEHRNFFGAAEKLTADFTLSGLRQSLEAALAKPAFLRRDQTLSLDGALRRQDTEAFEERGIDLGAGLGRTFSKRLSGTAGVDFTLARIQEKNALAGGSRNHALVSLPGSLVFDNRDNTLDPSRGWLVSGSVAPFMDALGAGDPFLKVRLGVSTYKAFDDNADYVLALRAAAGSILGSGAFDIPPTERFYAGGGSVRGFGYQEVGPKDAAGDPLGGRSLVTAAAEFRVKFSEKFGGAVFADAGNVSDDIYPDAGNLAVGAGAGGRYYTDFGPLRFDVALPLTRKEDAKRSFQFYISVGQAF